MVVVGACGNAGYICKCGGRQFGTKVHIYHQGKLYRVKTSIIHLKVQKVPPLHSYNHHHHIIIQYTTTSTTQPPPYSASYTSAIGVFAPLAGRKTPPAQVAEGQGDQSPASISASWSGMQQQHATCTWAQLACNAPTTTTYHHHHFFPVPLAHNYSSLHCVVVVVVVVVVVGACGNVGCM